MTRPIRSRFIAATMLIMLALSSSASLVCPAAGQSASEPLTLGPIQVLRDGPSYLDFAAGAFNIQGNRYSSASAEARVEFRYGRKLWFVGPAAGVLANAEGGAFAYGGLYSDFQYDKIVATPLVGLGAYRRGGSEDLGGVFQFRLSLGIAYELGNSSRIGLQIAHISNANLHELNPSENELLLTYAIPLQ